MGGCNGGGRDRSGWDGSGGEGDTSVEQIKRTSYDFPERSGNSRTFIFLLGAFLSTGLIVPMLQYGVLSGALLAIFASFGLVLLGPIFIFVALTREW